MRSALRLPDLREVVAARPERSPQLMVLIDAEEEFDWDGGFDRRATGVSAMARLPRAQAVFDRFGIVPLLAVDYPVASQPEGAAPIAELVADGRCVVGAHLHPWVNPPHEEQVTPRHSFPGNLPRELEAAKLASLTEAIEAGIGVRPRVYQAGRYGLGPNTASILEEQGYEVDFSTCPPFDYSSEGGPDYSHCPIDPFWFGRERRLLGVPVTGAFVGWMSEWGVPLHRFMQIPELRWARLPGLLSRLGALDRLRLSPEGFSVADQKRLTRVLLAAGVRTFTYSFHAPSLLPGCTPYVHDEGDVDVFLERMAEFLSWFAADLGGEFTTPLRLKADLEGRSGART